jgi:cytochrome c oxidase subunit 4
MTDRARQPGSGHRSSVWEYAKVAIFLTIVTMIEIGLILPGSKAWYGAKVQWLIPMIVPILLSLTVVKFMAVVGFFMHLRHDRGGPRLVFFAPLVLAFLMILALMLLYRTLL